MWNSRLCHEIPIIRNIFCLYSLASIIVEIQIKRLPINYTFLLHNILYQNNVSTLEFTDLN